MTAKEKASELVIKFYPYVQWKMGQEDVKIRAKKSALLVANEMIGEIAGNGLKLDFGDRFNYWQEVKQEIEKL